MHPGAPPRLGKLVAVPVHGGHRPAIDIAGTDLEGRARRLELRAPGRWTLLVFVGPHCDACEPFFGAAPAALGLGATDTAELILRPPVGPEARRALEALVPAIADPTHVVCSEEAWPAYGVLGAPFFALVDGEAVVTEGVAWSLEQVAADVARARAGGR